MMKHTSVVRASEVFRGLGVMQQNTKLRYFQEHSPGRKFLNRTELEALPQLLTKPKTKTQLLMMEQLEVEDERKKLLDKLLLDASATADAMCVVDDSSIANADFVYEDISPALREVSATKIRTRIRESDAKEEVLMKQAVGADVIQLVTDEFTAARKVQIERRRKVLYDLMHPNPSDYRYRGKPVPPPPLAFGVVSDEAVELGNRVMLSQEYSLVKEAASTDYFFEINDIYQEVVFAGKANAGKSSLINALLGQPNLAKTSSTPNCTRTANFYQAATPEEIAAHTNRNPNKLVKLPAGGLQLTFVDLPGFGIEGMSDRWKDNAIEVTDSYLGVRRSVNTVFMCIDCERGLTKSDIKYFEWLENLHGMFWILLTKCDSVPHSRVCSVMRQVYQTITLKRRKHRKAYPFVLPVSARDGSNIETLRGLIAESTGLIAGDRLRQILKEKAQMLNADRAVEENQKLREIWQTQRAASARQFREARGLVQLPAVPSSTANPKANEFSAKNSISRDGTSAVATNLARGAAAAAPAGIVEVRECFPLIVIDVPDVDSCSTLQQQLAERRLAKPYGGSGYRMSLGVKRQERISMDDDSSPPETQASSSSPSPTAAGPAGSAEIPKSKLSHYFDTVAKFGEQEVQVPDRCTKWRAKENKWAAESRGGAATGGRGTKVFAVEDDGRYRQCSAGVGVGPVLADIHGSTRNRQHAWKARKFAHLASKACPTAPWESLPILRKEKETKENDTKMSKKELAAYEKNAGRIISGFDRFENEVTTSKFMTETRQVEGFRKQQQLHLNATAKIGFRQQPPGLLKQYGAKDTYHPTPSVLGL